MCLFFLEDFVPLDAKEGYLLSSWSDSKWAHLVHCEEIFDSELELLTPFGKPYLGYAARRQFTLLGNFSATHHGGRTMSLTTQLCSHLLGQARDSVAQWAQGARGLAMGGMTLDTHDRPHGLCP